MQLQSFPLPNAAILQAMSLEDFAQSAARMRTLMEQEAELLKSRRYQALAPLHEEKQKLAQVLELYEQRFASDPAFLQNLDAAARENLFSLLDGLAFQVEENFREVAVARSVNQRVMQEIMDVVREDHRPSTYGRNGQAFNGAELALSMNLNQKA